MPKKRRGGGWRKGHQPPEKPREYGLALRVNETTQMDGILIGPNGEFIPMLAGKPIDLATAAVEISYERPKKHKVLLRSRLDPRAPSLDFHGHLGGYDSVCAVDVNTHVIKGVDVSVAVFVRGSCVRSGDHIEWSNRSISALEFRGASANPDRIAWKVFCDGMTASPGYRHDQKIALVVDSHLQELEAVNAREIPVLDDFYLPPNVTLVYASDASADSIPNVLIKMCDREANAILGRIREGHESGVLIPAQGPPYTHYREWQLMPSPSQR